MKVLVFGGSSLVGNDLLERLVDRGYQVTAISRTAHSSSTVRLEWIKLDLDDPLAATALPRCEVVISLIPIWKTAALLEKLMLPEQKSVRLIAFSSTSVQTKADSPNPDDRQVAGRLRDGELVLEQSAQAFQTTILRPSMIYGAVGDRNVEEIARQLARCRLFPIVGKGSGLRQPVHLEDLALAVIQVLSSPATIGNTYDLGGGEVLTFTDMVRRIAHAEGVAPVLVNVPLWLARLGLTAASMSPSFRAIPRGALARTNKDLIFDNSPACADFGYKPRQFEPQPNTYHREPIRAFKPKKVSL